MIAAAVTLLAVAAVAAAGGGGGSEPTKTVSVVSPVEPTPEPPSSGGGAPKPNVNPCALAEVYDATLATKCTLRRHAPGWVLSEVWIPINQYSAQVGWDDATGFVAVDFEYRDNFSDGEAAVLATISRAYHVPEIWGMPPKDWSERTKQIVALVLNDPRNRRQLQREGQLRFKNTTKGWTLEGVTVKKRYSPKPATVEEAQAQSSSFQSYPTIYLPKE